MSFTRRVLASSPICLTIVCLLVQPSYQQNVSDPIATTTTTTTTTTTANKKLSFCLQKHKMSSTLATFWHDAQTGCELEVGSLVALYGQLKRQTTDATDVDQCVVLLQHHTRKQLINAMATQLEEAFVMKTLRLDEEVLRNLKRVQEIDPRVSQAIWERAVREVYSFVDPAEMVNDIVQLKDADVYVTGLQCLFKKTLLLDVQHLATLVPLLTFHLSVLCRTQSISVAAVNSFERMYRRLPQELRVLYESSTMQTFGLLNYQHTEYLYAPRDNGPDGERRMVLTWSQDKNSTDSDGHLSATFNAKGTVAIGSRYGATLKYLYADVEHRAAYFWIGPGTKATQWWHVIWPHESLSPKGDGDRFVIFENDETKELLCASTPYDENRRYVTLLSGRDNMENNACHWLITRL